MNRILVIGIETPVGRTVAEQLGKSFQVEGIGLSSLPAAEYPESLSREVDSVVYCGNASQSSWEPTFGTAASDQRWAHRCLEAARNCNLPFAFVSSDAVFNGPWVFHGEDSEAFADSAQSRNLRKLEQQVLEYQHGTVVRTNALGVGDQTQLIRRIVMALESNRTMPLDASVYSTPVSANRFAELFEVVLKSGTTGIVHLCGAERLSPWSFGIRLARIWDGDHQLIVPDIGQATKETALRCQVVHEQLGLHMPTITETLDSIVEAMVYDRPQFIAA